MEVDYFIALTNDEEKKKRLIELKKQMLEICETVENESRKPLFDWKQFEKEMTGDKKEILSELEQLIIEIIRLRNDKENELRTLKMHTNSNSELYLKKEKEIAKELFEMRIVCGRLILKMKNLIREMCREMQNQNQKTYDTKKEEITEERTLMLVELSLQKDQKIQFIKEEELKEIERVKQQAKLKIELVEREDEDKKQKIELETQVNFENIEDEKRKVLTEITIRTRKINDLERLESENGIKYSDIKLREETFDSLQKHSTEYLKFIQCGGIPQIINNELLLKEWVKLNNIKLLFDSQIDGWERNQFNNSITGKDHLLFINCTENCDIFGCYVTKKIVEDMDMIDEDHFVFSIENHNRIPSPTRWSKIKKMTFLKNWKNAFKLRTDEYFYSIGDGDILIQSTSDGLSRYSFNPISNYYEGLNDSTLTGDRENFKVTHLLVLQFY